MDKVQRTLDANPLLPYCLFAVAYTKLAGLKLPQLSVTVSCLCVG